WTKQINLGPAHQDPAKAPPDPTKDLKFSKDSATSLNQYYKDAKNTTETSARITPNKSLISRHSRHSLEKRGSGPLYCKDGPCADDSCCGPAGICGYGPDYCGTGCTSNCDAFAMCGEYSEEGEMPCGMNLCCSASGCTNGRTIGYYQSWNVRTRKCDTKTPKQLDTTGFTHLFYSFAFIDPISFKITPAHNDDIKQMREFTDLSKNGKLKTWIAIGGFDMSNENTSTHTAWSDMVSTKANRAAFISSVRDYMDEYGFTGVDLDWEYPGEPKRGGRKLADTRNFSMLLREMRAAYSTNYGISLTLAPDYWYLRWFDAKAMEPYVDFFGFMAYDLHGFWDEDVKTLGKLVRGQADIREISTNTIPLWFAGLDPKKINFGLALYGRGYTLADKSCNSLLCSFVGPSKKGKCTDSDGVMSLQEIKNLIEEKGLKPTYLQDSMMKQITWDDQWIGYDDEETFAAKKAFADGLCFGGSMIWSIDFQVAQCTAPCRFVLPPRGLPSPTTISISPYVTSLQLAPGSTTTITVTVPVIKTDSMEYYNVNITSGQTDQLTFTPTPSLSIQPVTTTLTLSGGETQVRTLVLPPWPSITDGPPDQWTTPTSPDDDPDDDEDLPPPSVAPLPIPDLEDIISAWPEDPEDPEPISPSPGGFVWPEIEIKPVPTPVSIEGEKPEGDKKQKTTCKLWFFWVCIDWVDLDISIQGWEWNLPVGVWGPGPPNINLIKLPPGFTISGVLPPWPKMTVLPGGEIKTPAKPADCSPAKASFCLTTSSFATTVSAGQTKTMATSVVSRCATITGCNFKDAEATKSVDACTLKRRNAEVTDLPKVTGAAEPEPELLARANDPDWECAETDGQAYYLLMKKPADASHRTQIKDFLTTRETALKKRSMDGSWFEIRSEALDFTAFYYVHNLGPVGKKYLRTRMQDLVSIPVSWHIRSLY
ncbi:oviduct-specific glycoprotein, partial [Fusarium tricinctum]